MALKLSRVLICDDVDDVCLTMLQESGIAAVKKTKLTKQELIEDIPNYEGLVVRSATKVTEDVIKAGVNLKVIGRAGTGVDNINVTAASQHGILVMNTPDGNTLSAAELACAMLLAISRHVARGTECMRSGDWAKKKELMGNELYGKTLGLVGLGRIGREVAKRMQSFGMKTIGYDPVLSAAASSEFGVEWKELEEIWPEADFLTLHTPLIPQTKHLINSEVLKKCKKGVKLINCARGGLIDEDALLESLNSGHCAAAGLDVFEQEPPTNLSLLRHPLVTSTPHLGASTEEAQRRVAHDIARQFIHVSNGISLDGAVNGGALMKAFQRGSRSWIDLCVRLGSLARSVVGQPSKYTTLKVALQGSSLRDCESFIVPSVLVGLLDGPGGSSSAKLINAKERARSIGIQVVCSNDLIDNQYRASVELTLCQSDADRDFLKLFRLSGVVIDEKPHLAVIGETELWQPIRLDGQILLLKSLNGKNPIVALTGKINTVVPCVNVISLGTSGCGGDGWSVVHLSGQLNGTVVEELEQDCSVLRQIHLETV